MTARSTGNGPDSGIDKVEERVQDWRRRVHAAASAYYKRSGQLRVLNYLLGIPVVVVTTLVGTTAFSSLDQTVTTGKGVFVGGLSVLAAVLASLQTFLRPGERAILYGQAGDWYSAMRREMEEYLTLPPEDRDPPREFLDSIRKEWNKANQRAPELGQGLWETFARRFNLDEALPRQSAASGRRRASRKPQM